MHLLQLAGVPSKAHTGWCHSTRLETGRAAILEVVPASLAADVWDWDVHLSCFSAVNWRLQDLLCAILLHSATTRPFLQPQCSRPKSRKLLSQRADVGQRPSMVSMEMESIFLKKYCKFLRTCVRQNPSRESEVLRHQAHHSAPAFLEDVA